MIEILIKKINCLKTDNGDLVSAYRYRICMRKKKIERILRILNAKNK